jgi:hypothetical protein
MTENINEILLAIQEKHNKLEYPGYHVLPYNLLINKDFILEVLKIEANSHYVPCSIYRELRPTDPNLEKLHTDPDIIEAAFKATKLNIALIPENKITLKMAKDTAHTGAFNLLPQKFQNIDEIFNIFINTLKIAFYLIENCNENIINKAFIELVNQNYDFLTDANIRASFIKIIPKLNKEAIKYLDRVNPLYINRSSFNDCEEVALYLLKGNYFVFNHISKRLKTDKSFVKKAMNINPKIWTQIPNDISQDPELINLKNKLFKSNNIKIGEWGEYL